MKEPRPALQQPREGHSQAIILLYYFICAIWGLTRSLLSHATVQKQNHFVFEGKVNWTCLLHKGNMECLRDKQGQDFGRVKTALFFE